LDVQNAIEAVYRAIFREIRGEELALPLERVTWQSVMDTYGSDKPDRRFGLTIHDISDIAALSGFSVFENAVKNGGSVRGINGKGLAGKLSRKEIDALGAFVKTFKAGGLAWHAVNADGTERSSFAKNLSEESLAAIKNALNVENGDILFIVADKNSVVLQALGQLRTNLAYKFELIDKNKMDLFWVTEFPLLEWSDEEGRFVAMHHPFTSPMREDLEFMQSDPGRVRANAYDLVFNGFEMGSGSIRIHDADTQANMFKMIGLTDEEANTRFGFLLEAFKYGVPPHGGFAFGIDRLMMILSGKDSLRDVIAFPKGQSGVCLMMQTPAGVDEGQLSILGLHTLEE
jgi:aspartyl-tRNA synthetase